jgi:DNA-binding transcriptional LysR family regulator
VNLRRLRYFVVVAEEQNLHRASARLHIAQPALSRQIRILEEELETTLFDRLSRGIRLSLAGHSFLEDARQILRLADQARSRARSVESGKVGTLRVGFHDAAHHYPVLRTLFARYRTDFANVHFRFVSSSSQRQVDALLSNELDVGFAYSWEQPVAGLNALSLARDDIGLAVNCDHPLATKPRVLVEDLVDEPFLWADTVLFRSHSDAIMRACAAAGFFPNIWHQGLTSLEAMISLVAAGMGLAIVPQITSRAEGVVIRKVEQLTYPVELLLLSYGGNPSAALANFIDYATAVAGERPASGS